MQTARRKYKTMQAVADEKGVDIQTMLTNAFREHATIRSAASALGLSYTSVQWWLARNGLEVQQIGKLVKRGEAIPESQN